MEERRRGTRRIIARVALAAALVASSAQCDSGRSDAVRVGVLLPYSPDTAEFFFAMQLAVDEVNDRGGVRGRPIELVLYDVMWDPAVSYASFGRAVDDGAVAVIGGLSSSLAIREMQAAQERRIPLVGCCATSDALTNAAPSGDARYFFRVVPPDRLQSAVLADRAYGRPEFACRELAIVHTDDTYGNPLATALALRFESLGGSVVADVAHPFFTQQWSPFVATVAAAAPDCIVLASNVDDARGFHATWLAESQVQVHWLAADAIVGEATTETYADPHLSDGIVAAYPWSFGTTRSDGFLVRFAEAYGSTPSPSAAGAYDAAAVIALALVASPSLDGPDIRDALVRVTNAPGTPVEVSALGNAVPLLEGGGDVDYLGLGGTLEFDACGDVVSHYALLGLDADLPNGYSVVESGIAPTGVTSSCR